MSPTHADAPTPRKRLVYVLERFPADTLNFVYNEIEVLESAGYEVEIHSLRPCKSCPVEAEHFLSRTRVVRPLPAGEVFAAFLHYLVRRPGALLWLLSVLPLDNRDGFARKFLRSFAHVGVGVVFAYRLRGRQQHVHAHFASRAAAAALCAAKLNGTTYSFTSHGSATVHPPSRYSLATKVRGAAFVIAISDYNRRLMLELCPDIDPGRIIVNRTGILPERFPFHRPRPPRNGPAQIVCVAKLYPIKNHEGLLRAAALLKQRGVEFRLRLAGLDELGYQAYLERLAADLEVADRVTFLGSVDHGQVAELVAAADLFVLVSHSEGVPVSVMEAMAVGTPVVAPRVTGVPELIEDGRDGWLADPTDPQHIADTIAAALAASDRHEAVALAARRRIESEYDFRANANALARIFAERVA